MNICDALKLMSVQAQENQKVQLINDGRDTATIFRRSQKAFVLHLGALKAYLCDECFPNLSHYQKEGDSLSKSWDERKHSNPMRFLEICAMLPKTLHELPVVALFPFMIHSVLYFVIGGDPDPNRCVEIMRNCLPRGSSDKMRSMEELSEELFQQWENILPASFVFKEEKKGALFRAWGQEVTDTGLVVPGLATDAVFEDFQPWVATVMRMTQTPLPPLLREAARIYYQHREFCVNFDEKENRTHVLSYGCYVGHGFQTPQIRDCHIQTIIASVWANFQSFAQELSESVLARGEGAVESCDQVVADVLSELLRNITIVSYVVVEEGQYFNALHPDMWLSVVQNQKATSLAQSCEECAKALRPSCPTPPQPEADADEADEGSTLHSFEIQSFLG